MSKRVTWEPVPMGEIVLVDPDDSQLGDTIIVDATGCFMRVCEDHRQAEVWLPDTLRLCRQVEEREEPRSLDAPDSPGWWAFEGRIADADGEKQLVCNLVRLTNGKLYVMTGSIYRADAMVGKWYRLTMPWSEEYNADSH